MDPVAILEQTAEPLETRAGHAANEGGILDWFCSFSQANGLRLIWSAEPDWSGLGIDLRLCVEIAPGLAHDWQRRALSREDLPDTARQLAEDLMPFYSNIVAGLSASTPIVSDHF